jgi:hypothetical protein
VSPAPVIPDAASPEIGSIAADKISGGRGMRKIR